MSEPQPIDIGLIDPSAAEFFVTEGGFTGLRLGGREYRHTTLRRISPIHMPDEYISVADHENKEIGILRDVRQLSEAQRVIVQNELDTRYYSPKVLEILSVRDKLGYVYLEMKISTRSGRVAAKSCAVKDVNKNIRMLSEKSVIIFDVDGNRYIIEDLARMDKVSIRKLDPYLF